MTDIELVIRIPEETLNIIKNEVYCGIYDSDLYKAIANGTVLPKEHGRLIECERLQEVFRRNVVGYAGFKQLFDIAPTIIGADMRGEEE